MCRTIFFECCNYLRGVNITYFITPDKHLGMLRRFYKNNPALFLVSISIDIQCRIKGILNCNSVEIKGYLSGHIRSDHDVIPRLRSKHIYDINKIGLLNLQIDPVCSSLTIYTAIDTERQD